MNGKPMKPILRLRVKRLVSLHLVANLTLAWISEPSPLLL